MSGDGLQNTGFWPLEQWLCVLFIFENFSIPVKLGYTSTFKAVSQLNLMIIKGTLWDPRSHALFALTEPLRTETGPTLVSIFPRSQTTSTRLILYNTEHTQKDNGTHKTLKVIVLVWELVRSSTVVYCHLVLTRMDWWGPPIDNVLYWPLGLHKTSPILSHHRWKWLTQKMEQGTCANIVHKHIKYTTKVTVAFTPIRTILYLQTIRSWMTNLA